MKAKYLLLLPLITILSGCVGGIMVGGAAAGAATVHDRRTVGTVLDDQVLSWDISHAIYKEPSIDELGHVNVTVFNNTVLLSGEVPTEDLKVRANAIAAEISGKRQIFNELTIRTPTSFFDQTQDAYITTKAKAAMLDIKIEGFDPSRVKITTEAKVVYLMGLVTNEEAEAATDKIRAVDGVAKVIRLFEYITPESTKPSS